MKKQGVLVRARNERARKQYSGRQTKWFLPSGMSVAVVVRDARVRGHRVEVEIEPLRGDGTQWVSAERTALEYLEL